MPGNPALRAPVLGFGLGAVAGGFEMAKLAATLKLSMGFADAAYLGTASVVINGLLGAVLSVPVGILVAVLTRGWLPPKRYTACMGGTALLLAGWYLWPASMALHEQGRTVAAVAFASTPIGLAGVVWFNALYWFRREEVGERYRVGWRGWSLIAGLSIALVAAGVMSQKRFGSGRALEGDPDVLLVTIDTLRRDHISAYGDSPVQTPVFDALAAEGVRYDNAITPFPETAPAHAAMFTGRHPVRNGVLSNGHRLAKAYTTLAEVLEEEGYATGAFLSSYAVDAHTGLDQGFQVYDDDFSPGLRGLRSIRLVAFALRAVMRFGDPLAFRALLERSAPDTLDVALSWMSQSRATPMFVWIHLFEPHAPYEPHGLPGFEDNGTPGAPTVDHAAILSDETDFTYTDEVRQQLRRLYAEEVAYTDQQLGTFLDAVEALALDRPRTLIVVSDHGEMLGEHGIDFNHHGIWDETIRIPLVIVPHRLRAETRVIAPQVRLMDLPATVLDVLKLDPMKDTESGDLLGFAEGIRTRDFSSLLMGRRTASLSKGTLYGYRAAKAGEGIAAGNNIKYVWSPEGPAEALYDLATDPGETTDIGADQPDAVAALRQRVQREISALEESSSSSLDPSVREALRALGYVD